VEILRKYLLGFLVGILFASAVPAYGAVSSLVGKKVSSEITVKLDKKEIGTAIVVDGRSYLPVRSLSDAIGLKLNVTKEEVSLLTGPVENSESIIKELEIKKTGRANLVLFRDRVVDEYDNLKLIIDKPDNQLAEAKAYLLTMGDEHPMRQVQLGVIETLEQGIKDREKRLVELQTEIDKFNQQITERDVEIAELESKLQK